MVNDYDVFLSYARADGQAAADAIVHRLRASGLRVWSDQSLVVGEAMAGAVERAMKRARVIVVLLSRGAAQSQWVQKELAYALRRQTSVIPVVLDHAALDSPLGSLLGDRVFVDVSNMGPPELAEGVLAALQSQGFLEARRNRLRRWITTYFVAALFVLAVVLSWAVWRTMPSQVVARIRAGTAAKNQQGVNLARVRLIGANIEAFDFSNAVLSVADLSQARASFAKFDYATMSEAKLRAVTARSASFVGTSLLAADLRGADLTNSRLRNADLRLADLRGTMFSGAFLEGVKLEGASFDKATQWPKAFDAQRQGARCVDCLPSR
jgi:hypothetical protein